LGQSYVFHVAIASGFEGNKTVVLG
jgi:hypothetical protein